MFDRAVGRALFCGRKHRALVLTAENASRCVWTLLEASKPVVLEKWIDRGSS